MIELISAGIGVIGVVIGWVLNELTTTCLLYTSDAADEL